MVNLHHKGMLNVEKENSCCCNYEQCELKWPNEMMELSCGDVETLKLLNRVKLSLQTCGKIVVWLQTSDGVDCCEMEWRWVMKVDDEMW